MLLVRNLMAMVKLLTLMVRVASSTQKSSEGVFFPLAHLFVRHRRSQCTRTAAYGRSQGAVGEVGRPSCIAKVTTKRQLQQRRREGAGEDAAPALDRSGKGMLYVLPNSAAAPARISRGGYQRICLFATLRLWAGLLPISTRVGAGRTEKLPSMSKESRSSARARNAASIACRETSSYTPTASTDTMVSRG